MKGANQTSEAKSDDGVKEGAAASISVNNYEVRPPLERRPLIKILRKEFTHKLQLRSQSPGLTPKPGQTLSDRVSCAPHVLKQETSLHHEYTARDRRLLT